MTNDQQSELRLLQIRNAIADKEFHMACAKYEFRTGGWKSEWKKTISDDDRHIEFLIDQLNKGE